MPGLRAGHLVFWDVNLGGEARENYDVVPAKAGTHTPWIPG